MRGPGRPPVIGLFFSRPHPQMDLPNERLQKPLRSLNPRETTEGEPDWTKL